MITRRERFLQIARFERGNDPYIWGLAAWNEALRRWTKEGMPVPPKANAVHHHLVGDNDVLAFIKPNAAGLGLGENGNPPWVPPLDPFFEPEILQEEEEHIIKRDYDGNIEQLLPIWLDCGINGTFPLECASNMDALKLRKKYGKELWMVGNVDKRALAKGRCEIDRELEKVRMLIKDGGYFVNVDHHVPPDVPYENIVYFLNEIRKMSDYEELWREIRHV